MGWRGHFDPRPIVIFCSQIALFDQDYARPFPHRGYLKQRPEGGLGPDGHDPLLIDRIDVYHVQHSHLDALTIHPFGLSPETCQSLQ